MADTVAVTCNTCGAVFWVSEDRASKSVHICSDCAQ